MGLLVDIRKDLGEFKLRVEFEAERGEVTGILGASGCGKSLTLRCIAGIVRPDAGRIVLDGRTLFDSVRHIDLPPQRRRVGFLFQSCALFPNMTVLENVAAGIRDRKLRRVSAELLLRDFFLEEVRDKFPRQLSGGQRQRAALARILAGGPEALLLDEPLSALDSYLKWQVELELMERLEKFSGPVLFVTHSRDEIRRHCGKVCVLDRGSAQGARGVEELFLAPATLSACLLSGCKNFSRARRIGDGVVEALDWGIALVCGAALPVGLDCVGIRAHDVRLADGPGRNRVECRVLRVTREMFSVVLTLASPGGDSGWARIRVETDRERWKGQAGDSVWVELPQDALLPLVGADQGSTG